jgi:hypothetical protein
MGQVFELRTCYSPYTSYSRYLNQWTRPKSLRILMRSARCEARVVYPIKDNTKHECPWKVEREGVNGLRGGRKCRERSG